MSWQTGGVAPVGTARAAVGFFLRELEGGKGGRKEGREGGRPREEGGG